MSVSDIVVFRLLGLCWGSLLGPKGVATFLDVMFGFLGVGGVLLEVRFGSLVACLCLEGVLAKASLFG